METWQFIILIAFNIVIGLLILLCVKRNARSDELQMQLKKQLQEEFEAWKQDNDRAMNQLRASLNESFALRIDAIGRQLYDRQASLENTISIRLDSQDKRISEGLDGVRRNFEASIIQNENRFKSFESNCIEQMKLVNSTLENSLRTLRESNDRHLDSIRGIVDEKLQRTLNERITESFKLVNDRLAEVYRGLGEMQNLAAGVGDLKRVLSNVKTRGILGEIQLGAILEEVLTPDQYVLNFDPMKSRGNERVEFAIKMPGGVGEAVYLPIDSKFPADTYMHLCDSYDSGDNDLVASARKNLCDTLKKCAKDISDKYINPPRTTDFAIMFLPTEGLYAEAVRLGLIEQLQRSYRVNIAGPSTMAALLNSLRMGFKTLAIQKRSSEVWEILASIKKEFTTFDEVLTKTRKSLDKANSELDALIGVRTRKILNTLQNVEALPLEAETEISVLIEE